MVLYCPSLPNVNEGVMTTTMGAANAANSGKMEGRKPGEKDSNLVHCCKNCHTRENRWKLHGKPSNLLGKNNGSKGRIQVTSPKVMLLI